MVSFCLLLHLAFQSLIKVTTVWPHLEPGRIEQLVWELGARSATCWQQGTLPLTCIRTIVGNPVLTWDQRTQLHSLRPKDRPLTSVTRVPPKSNLLSHVPFEDKLIGLVPSRQNFLLKETPIGHPHHLRDSCPISEHSCRIHRGPYGEELELFLIVNCVST